MNVAVYCPDVLRCIFDYGDEHDWRNWRLVAKPFNRSTRRKPRHWQPIHPDYFKPEPDDRILEPWRGPIMMTWFEEQYEHRSLFGSAKVGEDVLASSDVASVTVTFSKVGRRVHMNIEDSPLIKLADGATYIKMITPLPRRFRFSQPQSAIETPCRIESRGDNENRWLLGLMRMQPYVGTLVFHFGERRLSGKVRFRTASFDYVAD
jgi:hypothetical protein